MQVEVIFETKVAASRQLQIQEQNLNETNNNGQHSARRKIITATNDFLNMIFER